MTILKNSKKFIKRHAIFLVKEPIFSVILIDKIVPYMKYLLRLIIINSFGLFIGLSQSQSSTYESLKKKALEHHRLDSDSAFFYLEKMQLQSSSRCKSLRAMVIKANFLYDKRDCSASKELCLEILNQLNKKKKLSSCLEALKFQLFHRLSYIEKCLGNYSEAITYSKKYLQSCDKHINPDKCKETSSYQIALFYQKLGWHEKSISLLKKLLYTTVPTSNGDSLVRSGTHLALSENYLNLYTTKNKKVFLDSADSYNDSYYKVSESFIKLKNYTEKLYLTQKGAIQLARGNYDNSLQYLKKSDTIPLDDGMPFNYQHNLFLLASVYQKKQKSDSAVWYANTLLNALNKHPKNDDSSYKAYHILATEYHKLDKKDLAYLYASKALEEMTKIDTIKIKGAERASTFKLEQIKTNYETKEEASSESFFATNKSKIIFAILAIISCISGLFFLYQRKKKNILVSGVNLNKQSTLEQINITPDEEVRTAEQADKITHKVKDKETLDHKINNEVVNKILKGLKQIEKEKSYLNRDFNLRFVTSKLNTNTSYVSKVLNAHMGVSFTDYVNNLRIQYIKDQLTKDPKLRLLSLDALANDIGYSNASSFSKIFKKFTGVAPSKFIKELGTEDSLPSEK